MQPAPDTLLMFSGGIDSTHVLYTELEAGRSVWVHHVHLRNYEGRERYEAKAVGDVLTYLTNRGWGDRIRTTHSGFDYGTLRWVVRDHNIWAFTAAVLLASPRAKETVERILLPQHAESYVNGNVAAQFGRTRQKYLTQLLSVAHRSDVEIEYPIRHLTKAQIMLQLPRGLLGLTWYCRKPRAGSPCHDCHTCHQVDRAKQLRDYLTGDQP